MALAGQSGRPGCVPDHGPPLWATGSGHASARHKCSGSTDHPRLSACELSKAESSSVGSWVRAFLSLEAAGASYSETTTNVSTSGRCDPAVPLDGGISSRCKSARCSGRGRGHKTTHMTPPRRAHFIVAYRGTTETQLRKPTFRVAVPCDELFHLFPISGVLFPFDRACVLTTDIRGISKQTLDGGCECRYKDSQTITRSTCSQRQMA